MSDESDALVRHIPYKRDRDAISQRRINKRRSQLFLKLRHRRPAIRLTLRPTEATVTSQLLAKVAYNERAGEWWEAKLKDANHDVDRLRTMIHNAPHGSNCNCSTYRIEGNVQTVGCSCWKAEVFEAHDR